MKKFLSLAVVAAALAASVGCDDKDTKKGGTGSASASKPSGAASPAASGAASSAASGAASPK